MDINLSDFHFLRPLWLLLLPFAAVLPLSRNERLSPLAREIAADLRDDWNIDFDDAGAIGRRYRRQDEVGTPFCITVDFETLGENDPSLKDTVTIRHRDSMEQERVAVKDLLHWLIARVR